ncbi:MAG: ABC transporter ATP-binding protein [Alphaproteobacteria bacterium]|nr:ABC transporter ATP-binding protein [Alphaproteobacteria bacterium]
MSGRSASATEAEVAVRSGAVEARGLVKRYGHSTVLDGITFEARAGECLAILGPSGCGKTTALRCVGGFIRPDSGAVLIGGEDVTAAPPFRRQIGMVFQSYALFPHLSVFENVAFGLRVRGSSQAEVAERVGRALDMVRLAGLGDRVPKQLSGGQQQRVALARALVYAPRVLLLDEPLSNLDARLRVEMRTEIRSLQQSLGLTSIYVTHDQEEALGISDRVMLMRAGRVEQVGTPWEIYNRPATPFAAAFVGAANIVAAEVVAVSPGRARLRIAGAETDAVAGGHEAAGNPVWAVIRPENLAVEPSPDEGAASGALPAAVRSVTMLGPVLRIDADLADGASVAATLHHAGTPSGLRRGERVSLRAAPEHIVVMRRAPGEQPPGR